ncbi:alpha/beta fold hydrolase [Nocardia sp. NPDC059177]|uniref:alpha/beta fold hydrolase n=1 Tax=Nocardia sp. NPDC059177 TaxID=3346759 RepID=UPI0036AE2049
MTRPVDGIRKLHVAGDLSIHVEERGSGPVLLFVNNFFANVDSWRSRTEELAERFRVVTYDMRNQRNSSIDLGVSWDDHLADLHGLIQDVGSEPVVLVGSSISTMLCRDLLRRYPNVARGAVFVGPAFSPYGGRRRKATVRTWLALLAAGGPAQLFEQLYSTVMSDETVERLGGAGFSGMRAAFVSDHESEPTRANLLSCLDAPDVPQLLQELSCPIQMLVGEADFQWYPSALAEVERLIPDCRTAVLPGVGHLPYMEAPTEFQRVIGDFVDSLAVETTCERLAGGADQVI